MAKKLYADGKYIIADFDDGSFLRFPMKYTVIEKELTTVSIQNTLKDESVGIADADAGDWEDAAVGGTPYTPATLLTFLLNNTANFSEAVTSFEDIPDVPAYTGNGGKTLVINSTEDGIEARQVAKEAIFYIDQDGLPANPPTEVANHSLNNTGLTFSFQYTATGDYNIVSDQAHDYRNVWCQIGNNSDAACKVESIVDAFGQFNINFKKYMLDTVTPVVDGLAHVAVHIKVW